MTVHDNIPVYGHSSRLSEIHPKANYLKLFCKRHFSGSASNVLFMSRTNNINILRPLNLRYTWYTWRCRSTCTWRCRCSGNDAHQIVRCPHRLYVFQSILPSILKPVLLEYALLKYALLKHALLKLALLKDALLKDALLNCLSKLRVT